MGEPNAAPAILIVEDEPLIAMMLEDFLETLGYRVGGVADTVAEALSLIEASAFDAVILDVNLRDGESSWAIADALTARGVPFALATGGSADLVPEDHLGTPILSKPYTMDGLDATLTKLLARE